MIASDSPMRWSILKCLVVLAVAAGIAPAAAVAQNCKLSAHASPQVLYNGQSAKVNVLAHFPSPPARGGAYAFASSTFDVYASDPMWTFASAGAIVGNDVLGINASQAHWPQVGIVADPNNPIGVWDGVFKPQSNAPALIEIEADPTDFSVYPSILTSSSAECDAEGGNDFIFVNPLRVGRWLAAPGPGTTMEIQDDVIVDGRIITGENWDSASVGIVPTGTVTFFDSSTRVEFDAEPVTFTATVQVLGASRSGVRNSGFLITGVDEVALDAQRSRVSSMTVTFSGLEAGGYVGGVMYHMSDGSVRHFSSFDGFLGGIHVAAGDLGGDADGEIPGLVVGSIPDTFEARAGAGALRSLDGGSTWTLRYDQPVLAVVRGPNGQPQTVTIDQIDIHGIREAAARLSSQNNLRQLSLGCHAFKAEGVRQMTVTPRQGE